MSGFGTEHFERLSFHDNPVYGLGWEIGDPDRGEWHSRLVLDIDHILEWLCGADCRFRFRLAPATLVFEDATDLALMLDQGDSGGQVALQLPTIDRIERAAIGDQKICLDRPYWRWRILFNQPRGGEIAFGASGFALRLRAEPVLSEIQAWPTDRPRPPRT